MRAVLVHYEVFMRFPAPSLTSLGTVSCLTSTIPQLNRRSFSCISSLSSSLSPRKPCGLGLAHRSRIAGGGPGRGLTGMARLVCCHVGRGSLAELVVDRAGRDWTWLPCEALGVEGGEAPRVRQATRASEDNGESCARGRWTPAQPLQKARPA